MFLAFRRGDSLRYDALGILWQTRHVSPLGFETLTVRTTFDGGGLPLAVRRWATPDSAAIGVTGIRPRACTTTRGT